MPRIAAVDFGLKRIGLAISDETGRIALPLKMVEAGLSLRKSAQNILAQLAPYEKQIKRIVVGMPLLLNGKKGEMAQLVDQFIEAFRKETSIPIETMDERLTSAGAQKALKECNYSRKEQTRMIDSASATLLLDAYLGKSTGII